VRRGRADGHAVRPTSGLTTLQPRTHSVIIRLAVSVGIGLGYLALAEVVDWDTHQKLFWSGLPLIVLSGAIVENAITLDAQHGATRSAAGFQPAGTGARPLPQKPPGYHYEPAGGGVIRMSHQLFPRITHRG